MKRDTIAPSSTKNTKLTNETVVLQATPLIAKGVVCKTNCGNWNVGFCSRHITIHEHISSGHTYRLQCSVGGSLRLTRERLDLYN